MRSRVRPAVRRLSRRRLVRPPDGLLVRCIGQHPPALTGADVCVCSGLEDGCFLSLMDVAAAAVLLLKG